MDEMQQDQFDTAGNREADSEPYPKAKSILPSTEMARPPTRHPPNAINRFLRLICRLLHRVVSQFWMVKHGGNRRDEGQSEEREVKQTM